MVVKPGENQRCGAAPKAGSKRTEPCNKWPVKGEKRCRFHGGVHKHSAKTQARYQTNEAVKKAVRVLDIKPVEDPLTALKLLAGEVLAWKDEMARHVGDLTHIRYRTENAENLRAEVELFERAMDRCATVLSIIAKLNIDERLAAITEQQAAVLTTALFTAFEAAGLRITDTTMKKAIAKNFGASLRLVA